MMMTIIIKIITIVIFTVTLSNSSEKEIFFKNDFLVLYKNEKLKLQNQDPDYSEEANFYLFGTKCEIKPRVSIDFYDENSRYKTVDEFITFYTKRPLYVTKVVDKVKKKKAKDGRIVYSFVRQSIKVLNPRTLDAKKIPTFEYYLLVTAKDNKGFYEIFYEVCEEEKSQAPSFLENLLKSIRFLK